jgi:hypothetical protein
VVELGDGRQAQDVAAQGQAEDLAGHHAGADLGQVGGDGGDSGGDLLQQHGAHPLGGVLVGDRGAQQHQQRLVDLPLPAAGTRRRGQRRGRQALPAAEEVRHQPLAEP